MNGRFRLEPVLRLSDRTVRDAERSLTSALSERAMRASQLRSLESRAAAALAAAGEFQGAETIRVSAAIPAVAHSGRRSREAEVYLHVAASVRELAMVADIQVGSAREHARRVTIERDRLNQLRELFREKQRRERLDAEARTDTQAALEYWIAGRSTHES